jgi:hypothetical protein
MSTEYDMENWMVWTGNPLGWKKGLNLSEGNQMNKCIKPSNLSKNSVNRKLYILHKRPQAPA